MHIFRRKGFFFTYRSKSENKFTSKMCFLSNWYPLAVFTACAASAGFENSKKIYLGKYGQYQDNGTSDHVLKWKQLQTSQWVLSFFLLKFLTAIDTGYILRLIST